LLLGIWICHHTFGKSLNFSEMANLGEQHIPLFLPLIFLVVALVKSAQFPFSTWLPRAMEGPTTSSAVFYGSLSVHMGLFLLLRTAPFWENNVVFQGIVIAFGLITVIMATFTAQVQSSVKTQIAYSSIAQIGLMFIEVALGWHIFALVHFATNAFLRTYQLLVSPSVLNYLIHEQFYNFNTPQTAGTSTFFDKIKLSVYTLSIKEWNLDTFLYNFLWQPMKKIGNALSFINEKVIYYVLTPLFLGGLYVMFHKEMLPKNVLHFLPEIFSLLALMMILKAFTERGNAKVALYLIVLNQLFISLSIGYNAEFDFGQIQTYLSGILVSGLVGYLVLWKVSSEGESISLDRFHGHSYESPILTNVFLIACLGLSGFPITPTFIGEDLMLGQISEGQITLTLLTALSFILDGLAIFRIYSRVFLGQHEKTYHEVAYRSS
jgi:NADH-quinone oxidoreductase subunit L